MARISERKPGREDGGFTRTFGNAGLGALLSMTHATSISAGTELEKKIQDLHANLMTAEQLGQFLKNQLPNGKYVMSKDTTVQLKVVENQLVAYCDSFIPCMSSCK